MVVPWPANFLENVCGDFVGLFLAGPARSKDAFKFTFAVFSCTEWTFQNAWFPWFLKVPFVFRKGQGALRERFPPTDLTKVVPT